MVIVLSKIWFILCSMWREGGEKVEQVGNYFVTIKISRLLGKCYSGAEKEVLIFYFSVY